MNTPPHDPANPELSPLERAIYLSENGQKAGEELAQREAQAFIYCLAGTPTPTKPRQL